ncbi:hypothetical protein BDY19DRAFT_957277 [Irpex rosettiformis]|uniref:Uncharacterized protein n=1 Tax=Irpex rosettiformis TaxID=378272 RepID=A0ACB8TXX1_9APHY|nr:hypothetical protein BDY19DRAFT_957277 [Irpex rosettiformis]
MHLIALLLLTHTFVLSVFASPVVSEQQSLQVILSGHRPPGLPEYENGENPPAEDTEGWIDPRLNGGRFIDFTTKKFGEPLNVIISSLSDPFVLEEEGFRIYARSIGYFKECLGLHYGNIHEADLGDGLGRKEEHILFRQHYFPIFGSCWESLRGGHHFRAWRQNGTLANSGAWFIGASLEKDSSKNHKIEDDGYNLGRDWFVERAAMGSHWSGMWWRADVEWRTGLMPSGNKSINHGIPVDGRVAILTVHRL